MTPLIECRDFSFHYGSGRVLENIRMSLESNGLLFILGPNGAGKSTLLKCLLRLAEGRASGEILIEGRPLARLARRDLARLLAYVPQPGGRIPPFTVRRFLALSRYAWNPGDISRSEKCASVERALALADMRALAERPLRELSGGQRQRAYIAAALAQDAQALLLDEPTAFLDPGHAEAVNSLLLRLHRERRCAVVVVTHDLSLPLAAGGKALVLRDGEQAWFGDARNLAASGALERAFGWEFSYLTHPRSGKTLVVA